MTIAGQARMAVLSVVQQATALAVRALLVTAAWWVLVEGDPSALAFGIPVIAAAVATRSAVTGAARIRVRPWGLARLLVVFLVGLVRGGFDVARRALSPSLPVSPDWLMYPTYLSAEAPRRLLMMVTSVLPGTLTVDDEGSALRLHVLVSTSAAARRQVEALERSIAHAFDQAAGKDG